MVIQYKLYTIMKYPDGKHSSIPVGSKRGICHRCQVILDNPKGSTCFSCKREIKKMNNAPYNERRTSESRKEENKKYRQGKYREYNLRNKYGLHYDPITPESVCEICGDNRNLHIDHDHDTKQFRGVLCSRCNTFIGRYELMKPFIPKIEDYIRR